LVFPNQTLVYGDGALKTTAKFQISFFLIYFCKSWTPYKHTNIITIIIY
jgi:hypothetical protein